MTTTERLVVEKMTVERDKLRREVEKLEDELRDAKEELEHFRTAVAAVKWLWEKAAQQTPFHL